VDAPLPQGLIRPTRRAAAARTPNHRRDPSPANRANQAQCVSTAMPQSKRGGALRASPPTPMGVRGTALTLWLPLRAGWAWFCPGSLRLVAPGIVRNPDPSFRRIAFERRLNNGTVRRVRVCNYASATTLQIQSLAVLITSFLLRHTCTALRNLVEPYGTVQ